MRGAFVVKIADDSRTSAGEIEGCVEEVDSGNQFRFRGAHELIAFIRECLRVRGGSGTCDDSGRPETGRGTRLPDFRT